MIAFLVLSCGPRTLSHNAVNSLDWDGTYRGVMPCADCEGIRTEVLLNKDNTFVLSLWYEGKSEQAVTNSGRILWDKSGNSFALKTTIDNPGSFRFKVEENCIIKLDRAGKSITGPNAALYVLGKIREDAALTDKYWKLTELNGIKVLPDDGHGREMHMVFHRMESRVNGNAGCNNFFGTYTITDPGRIQFSGMASTMMACPSMDRERLFLDVLEKADSYSFNNNGDTLSLNRARMAPLARFVAVFLE